MGFTPLVDGAGAPSPQAVLERITGICATYGGGASDFAALLGAAGGGTLLKLVQDPNTLPPDWAVTKCGGAYQVWIAGTAQAAQLLNQVSGSFWTPSVPTFGAVNSFWLDMAVAVSVDIAMAIADNALPAPRPPISEVASGISILPLAPLTGLAVEFVGDSYGSAVATMLACAWAGAYGADRIRLCAFGAPKVFTSAYAGPAPGVWLRPHRNGDPVVYLPPTVGFRMSVPRTSPGADTVSGLVTWQHRGTGLLVQDNGLLVPDPFDTRDSWLGLGVFLAVAISQHLYNHVAAYFANLQTVPGALDAQGLLVLSVLENVIDLPSKPGFIAPPPPSDAVATASNALNFGSTDGPLSPAVLPQTQLAFVSSMAVNWLSPATPGGGPEMALQLRTPIDKAYQRFTMWLRAGAFTVSESHYLNTQSANLKTYQDQCQALVKKRLACCPTNVLSLRGRLSLVGRPRVVVPLNTAAAVPGLQGTANLAGDSVVCGVLLAETGTTPLLLGEGRIFVAFPTDLAMQNLTYYQPSGLPWDQQFDVALGDYVKELVTPGITSPVPWGTLAQERSLDTAPVGTITGIETTAGQRVATVNFVLPVGAGGTLDSTSVVRLTRVPGATQATPWNTTWRVFLGTTMAPGLNSCQIQLNAPATTTGTTLPGGFIQKAVLTFWAYNDVGPIFGGERRRGVRVFQPVGRRKIRRTVGY